MTQQRDFEGSVREVLTDRSIDVSPPVDWEDRVLRSGKRARTRRRVTVALAAGASAVAVVFAIGAGDVMRHAIPRGDNHAARPSVRADDQSKPRVETKSTKDPNASKWAQTPVGKFVAALPKGRSVDYPHLASDGTLVHPDGQFRIHDPVGSLERAGDHGVVIAMADELVYLDTSTGERIPIARDEASSVAVSADGKLVAWAVRGADGRTTLRAIDLRTMKQVKPCTLVGEAEVRAFIGRKVLLRADSSVVGKRAVWNFDTDKREEFTGYKPPNSELVDFSLRSQVAIYQSGADDCVHGILLDGDPGKRAAWGECGAAVRRLSPDGERGILTEDSMLRFVRARDGAFPATLPWPKAGGEQFVVWESDDSALVGVGQTVDNEMKTWLIRCRFGAETCERVESLSGRAIVKFASRAGSDPPADPFMTIAPN